MSCSIKIDRVEQVLSLSIHLTRNSCSFCPRCATFLHLSWVLNSLTCYFCFILVFNVNFVFFSFSLVSLHILFFFSFFNWTSKCPVVTICLVDCNCPLYFLSLLCVHSSTESDCKWMTFFYSFPHLLFSQLKCPLVTFVGHKLSFPVTARVSGHWSITDTKVGWTLVYFSLLWPLHLWLLL